MWQSESSLYKLGLVLSLYADLFFYCSCAELSDGQAFPLVLQLHTERVERCLEADVCKPAGPWRLQWGRGPSNRSLHGMRYGIVDLKLCSACAIEQRTRVALSCLPRVSADALRGRNIREGLLTAMEDEEATFGEHLRQASGDCVFSQAAQRRP